MALYTWIKVFGEAINTLPFAAGVALIEMDEWHNLGQKKSCWLWVAVDCHGKQLLHGELGARDTATGQLWEAGKSDTIGHKRLRRARAGKVVL